MYEDDALTVKLHKDENPMTADFNDRHAIFNLLRLVRGADGGRWV